MNFQKQNIDFDKIQNKIKSRTNLFHIFGFNLNVIN